jgi:hypothetical protein
MAETLTYRIKQQLLDFDDISDSEIEVLDGVVAGTVAASKAVVVDANKDVGAFRYLKETATAIAAAGNSQGTATAVAASIHAVTAADGVKGVILPTAVLGMRIRLINTSTSAVLKVYPATGGQINALGANAAFSVGPDREATFTATSTTLWYTPGIGATTADVAELNILDGVQSSNTEINYLNGALLTPVANKVAIVDANGIIRHADAMNIDMADGQLVLTAVAGVPAGTLLTSDLLYVDPNSTDTVEDLLLPPEANCVGKVLFIHNVGGENIAVKEDSDTTVLGFLTPDDLGIFMCDGTNWQGGAAKQNMVTATSLAPWEMKSSAGLSLTASDTAGTFHIGTGSVVDAGMVLLGEVSNGTVGTDTETSVMTGRLSVPMNYIAGQYFAIALKGNLKGTGAVTATPSIDLTAKIVDSDGALGADICSTAALTLASGAPVTKLFTITPTTIYPGAVIEFSVTTVVDNTNSTDVQSEITSVSIIHTVNN